MLIKYNISEDSLKKAFVQGSTLEPKQQLEFAADSINEMERTLLINSPFVTFSQKVVTIDIAIDTTKVLTIKEIINYLEEKGKTAEENLNKLKEWASLNASNPIKKLIQKGNNTMWIKEARLEHFKSQLPPDFNVQYFPTDIKIVNYPWKGDIEEYLNYADNYEKLDIQEYIVEHDNDCYTVDTYLAITLTALDDPFIQETFYKLLRSHSDSFAKYER